MPRLRLIAGGRVQEVNVELVPELPERRQRACRGALALRRRQALRRPLPVGLQRAAYNTKVFSQPPKSWEVVFKETTLPDGKSNKGRVQAFDGPIYIADAALYLMQRTARSRYQEPLRAE